MADEKKQAVSPENQGKGTEAIPETSPVSKEEQASTQRVEERQAQEQPEEAERTTTEKPSRLEKRIKSLEEKRAGIEKVLEKLKGQERITTQHIPQEFIGGDEPLIKPEELEEGVDPAELERRVQARVEKAKQEAIRQAVERVQYQNIVLEHLRDVETAPERYPELNPKSEQYDPDFEDEIVRLYQLQNIVYNPITGEKEFIPAVKLSEVYDQVKKKWEKIKEKGLSQTAGKIAEHVSSLAVAPSASTGEQEVPLEELRKNIWKNPRRVAEKLAKKLKVEE